MNSSRAFDERDGLAETLVASAERFQAEAWAEAREKEREKGSSGRARKKSGAKDVPLARRDPPAYARTLGALMDVILFAHKRGELEVSPETARRLWSAFVETPPAAARAPAEPSARTGPPAAVGSARRRTVARGRRRRFIPRPRPDVDDEAPRRVAERGAARVRLRDAHGEARARARGGDDPPRVAPVQGAVSAGGGGRRPRRRRDRRRGRRRREGPLGGTPSGEERDVTSEAPRSPGRSFRNRFRSARSSRPGRRSAKARSSCGASRRTRRRRAKPLRATRSSRRRTSAAGSGASLAPAAATLRTRRSSPGRPSTCSFSSASRRARGTARANGGARREAFLAKILARARDAARESREGGEAAQTLARRRAGRS